LGRYTCSRNKNLISRNLEGKET